VIGTSIGFKLHVRALRGAGFAVNALVGRDPGRTRERAAYFQIPQATTSVEEILDTDVDAVVVATPPSTHHRYTMMAIAAGKHVLCEKPFALDAGEAREMRDAVREAGLVGQVDHSHRWFRHRAAVREVVQSGAVGDPIQASSLFDVSMLAPGIADTPGWWLDRAAGGGWLRNFASHGIDDIRYMLGDFVSVCGALHNDMSRHMSADDGYAFAFRLANGCQGVMSGTCRAWDFVEQVRVTGTAGTAGYTGDKAWVRDMGGARDLAPSAEVSESLLAGGEQPGPPEDRLPPFQGAYGSIHSSDHGYTEQVCLSRSFHHRIVDPTYRHPAVATFDDGVAHMEVIDAVEESASSGRWQDVSGARG
jgi:predicted dehydrogenase